MAISYVFKRAAVGAATLFLTAALIPAAPARANVVFDFSGECTSGCAGTATGVLTLADGYVFGTPITTSTFISFAYSSSNLDFSIITEQVDDISGSVNADGSLPAGSFSVDDDASRFIVTTKPDFLAQDLDSSHPNNIDEGSSYTLAPVGGAVPEPSTWAMTLIGFAGLGYLARKQKRSCVRDECPRRMAMNQKGI